MPQSNGNGQSGTLRWVITTLLAVFAGAGADRIAVEGRISRLETAIQQNAKELAAIEKKLGIDGQ